MSSGPVTPEPSRDQLLAEVEALRQRVEELEQEKQDLEVMLEMATEHADDLSEQLEQERDDLEVMLEMTTEHADAVEEELQIRADALEARSQFIQQIFGRYVSEDVVAQLLDDPEGLELGGEKRTVTIMMSDLRGFTAVAERLDPQEVLRFLNRYLEAMVNVILFYQGTIIEILGDGILVLFGAPIGRNDDPERAVACAVSMQHQMEGVNALLRQEHLPEIEMGIGLHTGDVVVGNIGSAQRTKYGVVGSAVNLTGRVESYTTGSQILISPTTYRATAELLTIRQALTVEPKGIPEPMTIYDVIGIGGAYQLFLPESQDDLAPLAHEIPVSYRVLEGKFAGPDVLTGRLVQLGVKAAELHSDEPVATLSNLKLTLYRPSGEPVLGELFAKVVGDDSSETGTHVVIRFTSISQDIRTFLDAAELRYEYHTINRSVQL
jgi:adenylate cyclase